MTEDLSRDTANLRNLLIAFADEFPKAVESGRKIEWATAVHSVIDLFEGKRYDAAAQPK